MRLEILVPALAALAPGLLALVLASRRAPGCSAAALAGGGGWIAALAARMPILSRLAGSIYSAAAASLLAGVFEETVRYLVARGLRVSRRGAVCLGLGWGLTEALLIYAAPSAALLLSGIQKSAWSLMPGAVERNAAIVLHVALSLAVWKAYALSRRFYLAVAVASHAAANMGALLAAKVAASVSQSPWAAEAGVVGVVAVVVLALWRLARLEEMPAA